MFGIEYEQHDDSYAETSKNFFIMTSTASTEYLMYFSGFFVKGKLANLQKKKNQIQPNQHGIRNKV